MTHSSHSAATDDDLVAALQAITTLSVCLPERVILPALHVGLTHRSRTVRAAAAHSVSCLLTGIQTTLELSGSSGDDQRARGLYAQLANELMESGILLLLVKSVRDVPNCKAVVTYLQPFFDDYTKEYLIASHTFLAQQQLRNCLSLLKAGARAAAHRNESTAGLLAWAHTRSAQWAASVCPPPNPSLGNWTSVMFPCAFEEKKQSPRSADPCLENHIAYLQCNTHAQSVTRLSPGDASASCQSQESAARRCDYAHDGFCGWDGASSPPFSVIKSARTRSGPILYHAHDLYFRVALELYGEWAPGEVEWCLRFLPPGATFIDAGAHVGTISLAVASQLGPSSTVIAIEATRFFASLAQANAVVAGLANMRVIHAALSNTTDCLMARADHTNTKIQNMGGQAVIHCPERVRRACADRNCGIHGETFFDGTDTYEWLECPHYQCTYRLRRSLCTFVGINLMQARRVPSMLIDDLGLQRCDVLKMDVEAMEGAVALGARRTISAFKPMIFYENNGGAVHRADSSSPSFMDEFGYTCYTRAEPLSRSNNWAGSKRDVFTVNGQASESHMMFCVHPDAHNGADSFFLN